MRAILVLLGLGGVLYGVLVLLMTLGFATQVDPSLEGAAWRAAVTARLFGTYRVGLFMAAGGLIVGIGLIVYGRFGEDRGITGK